VIPRFWIALLVSLVTCGVVIPLRADRAQDTPPPDYVLAVLPEDCQGTCWQGINPNETTYKEAWNIIAALPNAVPGQEADTWRFSVDGEHWHEVALDAKTGKITLSPDRVSLGYAILEMGEPDSQVVQFEIIGRTPSNIRVVSFFYLDQQVSVTVRLGKEDRLSPEMPISRINLYPQQPDLPIGSEAWGGFAWVTTIPSFSR
jgi:hypothetical protein